MRAACSSVCFASVLGAACATALGSNPFAAQVISYEQGSNPVPGYTNPLAAVGEPTRYTGAGVFPSAVTPFNPAFMPSEVVSLGEGGSLTLRFDQPVTNDVANPFGIDLLIFGNAFYADSNYPSGVAAGVGGAGNGLVEVSIDGAAWIPVGNLADVAFPTLGYSDLTDPYAVVEGGILSDFTKPVNPAYNAIGQNFAQIAAAYAGSGGGSGVDLGGVASIQFVRISNPLGSGVTVEVDAVSDVIPAPGAVSLVACAALVGVRRRRVEFTA